MLAHCSRLRPLGAGTVQLSARRSTRHACRAARPHRRDARSARPARAGAGPGEGEGQRGADTDGVARWEGDALPQMGTTAVRAALIGSVLAGTVLSVGVAYAEVATEVRGLRAPRHRGWRWSVGRLRARSPDARAAPSAGKPRRLAPK